MTKAKAKAKPRKKKAAASKSAAPTSSTFDDMAEGVQDRPEGPTAGGALTIYQEGQPIFDRDDVLMPFLRLAQGLSREVQEGIAKPGQWLLQGFDPADGLTVVPLAFARMRELRDEDTRDIECYSQDSLSGAGEPGGECAACPLAKWQEPKKKGGKNTPPECTFMYAYVVYITEHDTLSTLRFQRTSIKAGKMLNTIVAQRGLGKVAVAIGSDSVQGKRGTYSSPTVNAVPAEDSVFDAAYTKMRGA